MKFFLVSKSFERIYTEIMYTDDVSDKLFMIAAYENNEELIDMLKTRKLIPFSKTEQKLIKYWQEHIYDEPISVNWIRITNDDYNYISQVISMKASDYYIKAVPKEYLKFAYKLLDQFSNLRSRFKKVIETYKYKEYEVVYTFVPTKYRDSENWFFLDYKHNRYLIISILDTSIQIICNEFHYLGDLDDKITSRNHLNEISNNLTAAYGFLLLCSNYHTDCCDDDNENNE